MFNHKVLILDGGNSLIKFSTGGGFEGEFPHALKELTESEFQSILIRNNNQAPEGYIRVNGTPYAYGSQAERYTLNPRFGADRYRKDYYGVLAAIAMTLSFNTSCRVALFASHAPGNVVYRDDLMGAAWGDWAVEFLGKERAFEVVYANTFDEPQGGLMNVMLTPDGKKYQRGDLKMGRVLVIDIGGRSTDWLAVNPGGQVDYSLNESSEIGILDVVRDFERSFRQSNRDFVKATPVLPPDRVRRAIRSGVFEGSGKKIQCENEAREATSKLLNRIASTYHSLAGGGVDFDAIILTGGGSAMLRERLEPILNHNCVLLADVDGSIHFANARGGRKLWSLLELDAEVEG